MKENKICTDTYIYGQDYQLKSISSDLEMSCYGYHFNYWSGMVDGRVQYFPEKEIRKFTQMSVLLSANWTRDKYDVIFWLDSTKQGEPHASCQVEYLRCCETPEDPTPPSQQRFDKWIAQDSSYDIQNLQKVSCFMEFIAQFINQYYVSFKRQSLGESGESLCTLTCDKGDNVIYPDDYPDINEFKDKWPCYTVSSFSNEEGIINISANETIYINDISNLLTANCTNSIFEYDKTEHFVEVSSVTKNPYYEGECSVQYATSDIDWREEPIPFVNTGNYELSVKVSQDNYFDGIKKINVIVKDKEQMIFTFKGVYEDGEWKDVQRAVTPHYPITDLPSPGKTLSSEFYAWSNSNYENPSEENDTTSAMYRLRQFTASYYYDDAVPGLIGLYKTKTVEYGQDAMEAKPQLEPYGYTNDGWCINKTGRTPQERNMVSDSTLTCLTSDISVYTFSRKYHNINLFICRSDVQEPEVSANTLSIIDYTYLLSSKIGIEDVPNYRFSSWNPMPEETGWLIDADDFGISAVFTRLSGTLNYHSNYPMD